MKRLGNNQQNLILHVFVYELLNPIHSLEKPPSIKSKHMLHHVLYMHLCVCYGDSVDVYDSPENNHPRKLE